MALKLLPLMTGPEGLVRQSLTGEQASLAYQLEQARKRKNDTMGGVEQHREAKADMARLSDALVAAKDQSRVGGLPPEPMPPGGDVTVIEKGAGQQPIVAPMGVGGGAETAFTPIPPDRFGDPAQMASSQQIQDAFARRQTMMAQAPEAPPAPPAAPPTPPAPMLAAAQPPARPTVPERLNIGAEDWQRAQGNDLGGWISLAANELGVDAIDLATAISYETAGTFGLNTKGPRTKWGQHRGLIQWGEPQAAKYLNNDFSVASQMRGMVDYLRDAGVQPGMGLMDIYSAINAGQVGRYGASDAAAGGAPGTVADKVNNQMAGHRRKAIALLGGELEPTDEDWIRGGESAPSTALAYNAENAPMTPQGHPQADLINLLAAQQPPMAYAQSNWTPLAQAAPQTELSQAAPIVQGGGNQVSFGGDAVATPEQIDNRKALAAAMIAQGQGGQPIGHPLQAAGQVAQSAAGAYGMHRANQQELQRRQALAQALMAARGGGSLDPLYGIDPDRAFEIEEARSAAAADAAAQRARNEEWRERERYKRELDQEYAEPPVQFEDVRDPSTGELIGQRNPRTNEYKSKGPSTSVTVNNSAPAEDELRKTLLKGMGSSYAQAYDAGMQAEQGLLRLDNLEKNLSQTPGGLQNGLLSLASEYGIDLGSDEQSRVEAANAVIQQLVPMQRPPGSGEMSNMDVRMFQRSVPRLMNTPEGNALIIEGMRALAEYQIAHKNLIAQYSQGGMTLEQLNDAQRSIPNPFADYAGAVASLGIDLNE